MSGPETLWIFSTRHRAHGGGYALARAYTRAPAREGSMHLYPLWDKGYRRFFAPKKLTVRRMVTLLYWY